MNREADVKVELAAHCMAVQRMKCMPTVTAADVFCVASVVNASMEFSAAKRAGKSWMLMLSPTMMNAPNTVALTTAMIMATGVLTLLSSVSSDTDAAVSYPVNVLAGESSAMRHT